MAQLLPVRPCTAGSYYSSSSEVLSSESDTLENEFSRLDIHDNIAPFHSHSTGPGVSLARLNSQGKQPEAALSESDHDYDSDFSTGSGSSIERTGSPQHRAAWKECYSPSSTGKLTYGFPSPVISPSTPPSHAQKPWQSNPSSPATPVRGSPQLYRTRSGDLVTAGEIRRRRDPGNMLLDLVLDGVQQAQMFTNVGGGAGSPSMTASLLLSSSSPKPQQRSIAMCLDQSGRWRICSVWESWGP
ncbi:hypothetical protein F5Y17DRAFT_393484 [Xylariaceae sp. FL0594]|nr:hypothetical protein F5Y17DRAFT_393484 [Xylariaceae sp. FL0594]